LIHILPFVFYLVVGFMLFVGIVTDVNVVGCAAVKETTEADWTDA
jgi:hypothetical protein